MTTSTINYNLKERIIKLLAVSQEYAAVAQVTDTQAGGDGKVAAEHITACTEITKELHNCG